MFKLKKYKKDLKIRKKYKQNILKIILYKYIIKNLTIDKNTRLNFMYKLNTLKKNMLKVKINNRCVITGRSRSVYKFFRISRIKFRELAQQSKLPGIYKASW